MEQNNFSVRKIKRKNFFTSLGIGAAGFLIIRSLPFKLFNINKVESYPENKIKIKINPLAVSRNKTGNNNGRS